MTITPTMVEKEGNCYLHTWANLLTANATGVAISLPGATERTMQAVGANWGGATLSIEGSMDGGTTYAILKNRAGTAASLTADGVLDVYSNALLIRARLTTVGVGADVDCYLLSRKRAK